MGTDLSFKLKDAAIAHFLTFVLDLEPYLVNKPLLSLVDEIQCLAFVIKA